MSIISKRSILEQNGRDIVYQIFHEGYDSTLRDMIRFGLVNSKLDFLILAITSKRCDLEQNGRDLGYQKSCEGYDLTVRYTILVLTVWFGKFQKNSFCYNF